MKKTAASSNSIVAEMSILKWAGITRGSSLALLVLLGLVLSTGLSVIETTHDNRFSFNALQVLKDEANELDVEWGQLLLEQSTFGVDGRIEVKAVEQLRMRVPEITNIVMVKND
ncbi:MAG: cell division protein FtsL [Pseudohongiellaceae bacterium]|jgi:cell division protein FtsL